MWLFSDLDTLEFDLVLVLAAIYIVRAVRTRGIRNPSLWLILAMTVILTLPLIYTVTNFGSLFRLRGLTYLLVALIPLMAFQPVRRDFESAEIVSIPSERGSLDG